MHSVVARAAPPQQRAVRKACGEDARDDADAPRAPQLETRAKGEVAVLLPHVQVVLPQAANVLREEQTNEWRKQKNI